MGSLFHLTVLLLASIILPHYNDVGATSLQSSSVSRQQLAPSQKNQLLETILLSTLNRENGNPSEDTDQIQIPLRLNVLHGMHDVRQAFLDRNQADAAQEGRGVIDTLSERKRFYSDWKRR